MTGACAELRVLDRSTGYVGRIAAVVLADFGAKVMRVDRSAADASLTEPASHSALLIEMATPRMPDN